MSETPGVARYPGSHNYSVGVICGYWRILGAKPAGTIVSLRAGSVS